MVHRYFDGIIWSGHRYDNENYVRIHFDFKKYT